MSTRLPAAVLHASARARGGVYSQLCYFLALQLRTAELMQDSDRQEKAFLLTPVLVTRTH